MQQTQLQRERVRAQELAEILKAKNKEKQTAATNATRLPGRSDEPPPSANSSRPPSTAAPVMNTSSATLSESQVEYDDDVDKGFAANFRAALTRRHADPSHDAPSAPVSINSNKRRHSDISVDESAAESPQSPRCDQTPSAVDPISPSPITTATCSSHSSCSQPTSPTLSASTDREVSQSRASSPGDIFDAAPITLTTPPQTETADRMSKQSTRIIRMSSEPVSASDCHSAASCWQAQVVLSFLDLPASQSISCVQLGGRVDQPRSTTAGLQYDGRVQVAISVSVIPPPAIAAASPASVNVAGTRPRGGLDALHGSHGCTTVHNASSPAEVVAVQAFVVKHVACAIANALFGAQPPSTSGTAASSLLAPRSHDHHDVNDVNNEVLIKRWAEIDAFVADHVRKFEAHHRKLKSLSPGDTPFPALDNDAYAENVLAPVLSICSGLLVHLVNLEILSPHNVSLAVQVLITSLCNKARSLSTVDSLAGLCLPGPWLTGDRATAKRLSDDVVNSTYPADVLMRKNAVSVTNVALLPMFLSHVAVNIRGSAGVVDRMLAIMSSTPTTMQSGAAPIKPSSSMPPTHLQNSALVEVYCDIVAEGEQS